MRCELVVCPGGLWRLPVFDLRRHRLAVGGRCRACFGCRLLRLYYWEVREMKCYIGNGYGFIIALNRVIGIYGGNVFIDISYPSDRCIETLCSVARVLTGWCW
jgi:hypothetical protein